MDEILKCDHHSVYHAVQGGSNFWVCGWNLKKRDHSNGAIEQYFPVVLFIILYKMVLTFESVDEILTCDHLNENYWAVLSCGAVYYAVQGGSNFWVCGWNLKKRDHSNRAIEQYFPVVLFIILYKVVLTFE